MRRRTYLLFMLLAASATLAQPQPRDKHAQILIIRLKTTPVADLEDGLPKQPFGEWIAAQAKSTQVHYEAKPCDDSSSKSAPDCVLVTAKVGELKKLELTFAMAAGGKKAKGKGGRPGCRFLVGQLGPADPRMKFPTKMISRLSEVPPLLNP